MYDKLPIDVNSSNVEYDFLIKFVVVFLIFILEFTKNNKKR